MIFRKVSETVSRIISPPYCVCCGIFLEESSVTCAECENTIKPIVSFEIPIGQTGMVKLFSLSSYGGMVRLLILAKQSKLPVASKQLGTLIASRVECDWVKFDNLVPVPLHWTRYASRGFNQASVIASEISKIKGIPLSDCVRRVRRTVLQAGLSRKMRQKNVENSFELKVKYKGELEGKNLLILDDTMTTGATIKEVAKVLFKANPASISAVVAARVI